VRLLGEPAFRYGGEPLRFGAPPRSLELLAYLLLNRGAPLARDRLAALFWPEVTDSAARADLRRHLYYLTTRALPPGKAWFVGDKRVVQLNPALPIRFDVDEFEACARDRTRAAEATAWYAGDLLPHVESDWLRPHRERLHERAVMLLDDLVEAAEAARDPAAVVRFGSALAALEPWRESAAVALMRAHAERGDRGAARRVYRGLVRALAAEVGVEPEPATRDLADALIRTTRARSLAAVPPRLTRLFGRDAALGELAATVQHERVVSLVGPGGVGKTRLAQAFAVTARFPDGIAFVDLSAIGGDERVASAVAAAVGVREEHGLGVEEALAAELRDARLLLIVDGCEHVIGGAARTIERLARDAPGVHVIATTREPLRIEGERVVRVATLGEASGAALFADRARAAGAPESGDDRAHSAIARRLDGLPLAIELAAARAYAYSVEEIIAKLDDRLALLTQGLRTAEPRQQTLRALLDWSVDLLSPGERQAFLALALASGRFTREAAAALMGSAQYLDDLVRKSLVAAEGDAYHLLDTTRDYARERLGLEGTIDAAGDRLLAYALAVSQRSYATLRTVEREPWLRALDAELDTLRAALEWGFADPIRTRRASAIAAELDLALWDGSRTTEGVRWIRRALAALDAESAPDLVARVWVAASWVLPDGPDRIAAARRALELASDLPSQRHRARAYLGFAYASQYVAERRAAASEALERAFRIASDIDDEFTLAYTLHLQGDIAIRNRDRRGLTLYERSLAYYRKHGDRRGYAFVTANIGEFAATNGDYEAAARHAEDALAALRAIDERRYIAIVMSNIAMYRLLQGQTRAAIDIAREGSEIARLDELPLETTIFATIFAAFAARSGDLPAAVRLTAVADRYLQAISASRDPTEATLTAHTHALTRAGLDANAVARYRREGESISDPYVLIDAVVIDEPLS
jgi:predicted ATPase/DNA-binding SARP family transcriptional activator